MHRDPASDEPGDAPSSDDASGGSPAGRIVPMFPLPNVFLFPGTLMPLHIFEQRYRQMIEDSLDGPGRIVIATVLEAHHDECAGAPPVHHIAGLGEIARHERLPDGRFLIVLAGLARVLIREVPSDRLYRKAEAIPLREIEVGKARQAGLRKRLESAVLARCTDLLNLPGDMPLGQLTDFLLVRLQLPQSPMQDLYSCMQVEDRARRALAEHERRPLSPPQAPASDESGS
jgi:ATP-dependent Lon protease